MENVIKKLEKISILGRMAYAIECLENVILRLKEKEVITKEDEPEIKKIIETLWEFTESINLSKWEKKGVEIAPDTILDTHEDNKFEDYETLSLEELRKLKIFYQKCPNYFSDIVDECIEIGLSNLYGGIIGIAQKSIDCIINIIEILEKNSINIPEVDRYSKFVFKDGWGDRFNKSYLPMSTD